MGSAIRMDDWSFLAVGHRFNGSVQHGVDQLRIWLRSNRPTDDHAVKAIDDRRKVDLPGWDLELDDVCQPLHVRRFCMEVAIDQVLGRNDFAPKFYPALSLRRFWVAVLAAVVAGCGAEPFRPSPSAHSL